MKNTIGAGSGSPVSAVSQATKDIIDPSVIMFICSYDACEETSKLLAEKYPEAQIMGLIGTGIANGKSDGSYLYVTALYNDAKVVCGVIPNVSVCPVFYMKKIDEQLTSIGAKGDNTVVYEFTTGNEEVLVSSLNATLSRKGISLIGGTVFGAPEGKASVVAYNGKVYEDACVYAIIKNNAGKVKVYKENIYQKGDRPYHYATKVNVENRALCELDGLNAADVYSRELGINKNQITDNVFENPMGRVVGDEVFISSMKNVNSKGEIENYKVINSNDCIKILELGNYEEIEARTREMIMHDFSKISLVLSVDCVYRYLMYSNKRYFNTYISDMARLGNHFGIVGGGEQYNNQHVNQTMVCAVFE